MAISNINSNTAQLYTQEKPAAAELKKQQNNQAAATVPARATDSVQISEQARALLSKESSIDENISPLTNGMGIEPPKSN